MLCEGLPMLEVVRAFNSPATFLSELPNLHFDLCIMDIEMPGMNGLEVAQLLGGKPVIFTTAYNEYAAEAFDLDVVDYVRKPVRKERLMQAVEKARERISKETLTKAFIQLNTDKGKAIIFFDQLLYVRTSEVDSRDKFAMLTDGITLTLKNISFEKLLQVLPSALFCRINKKEVISMNTVKTFSAHELTAQFDKERIQTLILSEIYRHDFLSRLES
jgi:DNA-binding LytR/AlgR family response regulator